MTPVDTYPSGDAASNRDVDIVGQVAVANVASDPSVVPPMLVAVTRK
jgi:hypothetical protein